MSAAASDDARCHQDHDSGLLEHPAITDNLSSPYLFHIAVSLQPAREIVASGRTDRASTHPHSREGEVEGLAEKSRRDGVTVCESLHWRSDFPSSCFNCFSGCDILFHPILPASLSPNTTIISSRLVSEPRSIGLDCPNDPLVEWKACEFSTAGGALGTQLVLLAISSHNGQPHVGLAVSAR